MIKIPTTAHLGNTKAIITKMRNSFEAIPQYRSIRVTVNVDVY